MSQWSAIECPRCGSKRVQREVIAWWSFDETGPLYQGDSALREPSDPYACCEECGHIWQIDE